MMRLVGFEHYPKMYPRDERPLLVVRLYAVSRDQRQ